MTDGSGDALGDPFPKALLSSFITILILQTEHGCPSVRYLLICYFRASLPLVGPDDSLDLFQVETSVHADIIIILGDE